jgi:uncharacterized protein (TIGR02678 family)
MTAVDSVRRAQGEAATAEQRTAVRRLLARPLLGQREDPETFAALVRHRRALVDWFADHTGWQLVVDVSGGFARLHKTDATDDGTRPASAGRAGRPFDRRRYTLTCLTLAALDVRRGQTSLKHLAEDVAARSADAGLDPFDAARMPDRRAFVDALKLLVELGVIAERDGDVDRYATSGAGDALYDVDDRRLGQLISAPSSPSLVDGPADLPVEAYPDTDEGRRLRARHRVVRRLLDEPVVYYADLDEGERDWLAHSLGFVRELCERDVGLVVERRAEGLAAVDPARELTDETFPDGGSTVKHAALLLAEQLTARARAAVGDGEEPPVLPDDELATLTAELIAVYGKRCGWSAVYREAGSAGAAHLARDALGLLARFHLVARRAGGWQPRPAIARFAAAAPGRGGHGSRPAGASQPTLLGDHP